MNEKEKFNKHIKDKEGNVIASINYLNYNNSNQNKNYNKSYENLEVYITHKGKKYNERDLDLISEEIYKKWKIKQEDKEDEVFNLEEQLSESHLLEIEQYKKRMEASAWKSRQRRLRKDGKLEQYKIDILNKLGMTWDPKGDDWEKKYLLFRKYNLCDEIEEWVIEQRNLMESGKLSKENICRLKAVYFPFKSSKNEKFSFTYNSLDLLREKLEKKRRRIELKLFNNPPKKLNKNQKEIIKKEKAQRKNKENQKKVNSFYNKLYMVNSKIQGEIVRLDFEESKKIIDKIQNGYDIYTEVTNNFLDEVINKRMLGHFTRSYARRFYIDKSFKTEPYTQYQQISLFNNKDVNVDTRCYACKNLIKYFKDVGDKKMKSFKPLDFLIKHYKKEKKIKELDQLNKDIIKYPLLYELYKDKF